MRISILHLTFIPGPNVKRDFVMSAGTRKAVMAAQFRWQARHVIIVSCSSLLGFFPPVIHDLRVTRLCQLCFSSIGRMLSQPVHPPPSLSLHKTPIVSCLLTNGKRKRGVLEQIRRQVAFITNVGNTQENHKRRTWAIEFPDRENSKKTTKTVWDYSHNSEFLPQ